MEHDYTRTSCSQQIPSKSLVNPLVVPWQSLVPPQEFLVIPEQHHSQYPLESSPLESSPRVCVAESLNSLEYPLEGGILWGKVRGAQGPLRGINVPILTDYYLLFCFGLSWETSTSQSVFSRGSQGAMGTNWSIFWNGPRSWFLMLFSATSFQGKRQLVALVELPVVRITSRITTLILTF